MPDAPPLTIAIPTYNRQEDVARLCRAVLAQMGPEDELVVSDNASPDKTAEILSEIAGVTVVIQPENLGMVGNFNYCLTAGTHDWICMIHSDDRLKPDGLDAIRRTCALAGGPALIGHAAWDPVPGRFVDDAFSYTYSDAGRSAGVWPDLCPSGTTLHRDVVDAVGRFEPRFKYSSDMEFFPRVCAKFPSFIIRNPGVVEYVVHGENLQFDTWKRPDFWDQMTEIVTLVGGYTGYAGRDLEGYVNTRLTDLLLFSMRKARQRNDRTLVRDLAARLLQRPSRGGRFRLAAWFGATFGWSPSRLVDHA